MILGLPVVSTSEDIWLLKDARGVLGHILRLVLYSLQDKVIPLSVANGQLAKVFSSLGAQRLTADLLSTLSHSLDRVNTQVGNGQHRDGGQTQQQYQQSRPDTWSNRQTRGWLSRGDGRGRGFSLFSNAPRYLLGDLCRLHSGHRRGFRHCRLSFGWLSFEGGNDCFLFLCFRL